MSASSDPSGLIGRARSFPTLSALLIGGIGGVFLAVFEQLILFIQTLTNFFLVPIATVTNGAAAIVRSFLLGGAGIISQGARTTIASILPGASFSLGPFTFGGAILFAGLGFVVFGWILSLNITSNFVLGTGTDFPFVGADEEEQDPLDFGNN